MAINRSAISTEDIRDNGDVSIEFLANKPGPREFFDPPLTPNVMRGYYNSATGHVELYLTDPSGQRLIRVS